MKDNNIYLNYKIDLQQPIKFQPFRYECEAIIISSCQHKNDCMIGIIIIMIMK